MNRQLDLLKLTAKLLTMFVCGVVAFTSNKRITPPVSQSDFELTMVHAPSTFIELVTLGHKHLWDDLAWIWFLQLADDPIPNEYKPTLTATIHHFAEKRPKIELFYMVACFKFVEIGSPHECESLSLEGLNVFPESWKIAVTQGYVYALETEEKVKAAAYFYRAANWEGAPNWVGSLANKLAAEGSLNLNDAALIHQIIGDRDLAREFFRKSQENSVKGAP